MRLNYHTKQVRWPTRYSRVNNEDTPTLTTWQHRFIHTVHYPGEEFNEMIGNGSGCRLFWTKRMYMFSSIVWRRHMLKTSVDLEWNIHVISRTVSYLKQSVDYSQINQVFRPRLRSVDWLDVFNHRFYGTPIYSFF